MAMGQGKSNLREIALHHVADELLASLHAALGTHRLPVDQRHDAQRVDEAAMKADHERLFSHRGRGA